MSIAFHSAFYIEVSLQVQNLSLCKPVLNINQNLIYIQQTSHIIISITLFRYDLNSKDKILKFIKNNCWKFNYKIVIKSFSKYDRLKFEAKSLG